MKTLSTVTLCAVSSIKIDETIQALKKSMRGIAYAKVLLITHEKISLSHIGITVITIEKLDYNAYSHFIVYRLKDYIDTDFVLLVQYDGYVLHPKKWSDTFLQYDYIGSPWPKNLHFMADGTNVRVGNGGFSLRSKKLLHLPSELNLPFTDGGTGFFHEDGVICLYYRKVLESAGIQYAPIEIASRFGRERWCPDSTLFPFGFHNGRTLRKSFKKLLRTLHLHS
ncbi:MAG: DUF5672 family protein [Minisyncoccia bacterium]